MESEMFNVDCSDDECTVKSGVFEPPAEEIERLYALLDDGKLPEMKWQSPGYRSPTPTNMPATPVKEEQIMTEEKSDFDFMDEMSSPKLPVRREGEGALKGSAKKKTTSLDGVLSNMRRHRRLEMLDSQQNPTTT